MINSQDIKNGVCIRMDGRLYFVIEFLHVKPGKGNTIMRVKFKDVVDGRVLERRFNIGEKLEDVRVERRPYQYLYADGQDYIFMNQETYEQVPIAHDLITGVDFLKEGMVCDVVSDASTDTILFAELPTKVELAIAYTEPGLKVRAFFIQSCIERRIELYPWGKCPGDPRARHSLVGFITRCREACLDEYPEALGCLKRCAGRPGGAVASRPTLVAGVEGARPATA